MISKDLLKGLSKNEVYILGGIALVIIYFVVIKPLMKAQEVIGESAKTVTDAVGLTTSQDKKDTTKKYSEKLISNDSEWSPNFWRTAPKGTMLKRYADRVAIAKQIKESYSSWSGFDSQQAFSALKKCTSKAQVSQIVNEFANLYKKDLLNFLKISSNVGIIDNLLDDNRIKKFIDYAENLKDY